jgi:hypothetical protein
VRIPPVHLDNKLKAAMAGPPAAQITLRQLRRKPCASLQRLAVLLYHLNEIARQNATATTSDDLKAWRRWWRVLPSSFRPRPIRTWTEAVAWIRQKVEPLTSLAEELEPSLRQQRIDGIFVVNDVARPAAELLDVDIGRRLARLIEVFGTPDANTTLRNLHRRSTRAAFEENGAAIVAAQDAGDRAKAQALVERGYILAMSLDVEATCRPGARICLLIDLWEDRHHQRCGCVFVDRGPATIVDLISTTQFYLALNDLFFRIVAPDHGGGLLEPRDDRPRKVPKISARDLIRRSEVGECRGPPRGPSRRLIRSAGRVRWTVVPQPFHDPDTSREGRR